MAAKLQQHGVRVPRSRPDSGAKGPACIVLLGEHDVGTIGMLDSMVEGAGGGVIVDLTVVAFLDVSVIHWIRRTVAHFSSQGECAAIVAPMGSLAWRLLSILDITDMPTFDRLPTAVAAVAAARR